MTPVLVVHGGAGLIRRDSLTPAREARCREGLLAALHAGMVRLTAGGSALDAVEAAVCALEDDPHFNAGRGAVLNADGEVELDASIMESTDRRAGAIAGLRRYPNPIRIARRMMDDGVHVLQHGAGAERFAAEQGFAPCAPQSLIVPERLAQWHRARAAGDAAAPKLDHDAMRAEDADETDVYGTVGAVAIDAAGRLAAATSTGGMLDKRPGRVSDTAVIGAGTWAGAWPGGGVAVSCTGHGEFFLRCAAAHRVAALAELAGLSAGDAAKHTLDEVGRMGGTGGMIVVDAAGRVYLPFNAAGMFHGVARVGEAPRTGIWEAATDG